MDALAEERWAGFRGGPDADTQALGDSVTGKAASGSSAEQWGAVLPGAFVKPGPQQFLDTAVERDGTVLAALALAADGGALSEGDVAAVQAGEIGDPQAGLDGQGQHGLVPPSLPAPGVWSRQQCVDRDAGQEGHAPLVVSLGRDIQDALDEEGVLGVLESRVGERGADRGQPDVAGACAVAAFVRQMVEERGDDIRVQVASVQLHRRGARARDGLHLA